MAELAVFGSVLRDDFRPDSDVDVLITLEDEAPWSMFEWVDMIEELKEIFGRNVDLVEKTAIRIHSAGGTFSSTIGCSMRPDAQDEARLWDMLAYATEICDTLDGVSFVALEHDKNLRLATERGPVRSEPRP